MVVEQLRNVVAKAVDLALPSRCAFCGPEGAFLCGDCAGGLEKLIEPPVTISQTTGSTLEIRSLWAMEDSARHLIRQFKYGGFKALARPLGAELVQLVRRISVLPDLVTYVPLHRSKIRRRGYDQSKLLAEAIADDLGGPPTTALTRTRSGRPQVETRDRTERIRNVAAVFEASAPSTIAGKKVLLVDDVMTTEATLLSAGKVINDSGAHHTLAVTLTRDL